MEYPVVLGVEGEYRKLKAAVGFRLARAVVGEFLALKPVRICNENVYDFAT